MQNTHGMGPTHMQVAIPRLVPGMVSQAVLVESYEPGRSVAHFTKRRTPINTELVGLGVSGHRLQVQADGCVAAVHEYMT